MRERGAASAFLRTDYNPLSVRETRVTNTAFPHEVAPNLDCCSAGRDRGCYAGGRLAI